MGRKAAIAGIYRPNRLRKLDGRTREARRLREITRELVEHCGGAERVGAAQRFLIERTAVDLLRLELLDIKMTSGMSEHDGRIAHALRNAVRLSLRELGMKPMAPRQPTLADHLAALAARSGGKAA
jgi:hypothetical protein